MISPFSSYNSTKCSSISLCFLFLFNLFFTLIFLLLKSQSRYTLMWNLIPAFATKSRVVFVLFYSSVLFSQQPSWTYRQNKISERTAVVVQAGSWGKRHSPNTVWNQTSAIQMSKRQTRRADPKSKSQAMVQKAISTQKSKAQHRDTQVLWTSCFHVGSPFSFKAKLQLTETSQTSFLPCFTVSHYFRGLMSPSWLLD